MNRMKKLLCLALAVLTAASLLCGCETIEDKMNALCGTWTRHDICTEDQAKTLLENIDLYEEEIAFADLKSLEFLTVAEFNMDGTYRLYVDSDQTKRLVLQFFTGVFDALYENRASLNTVYDQEFGTMTEEQFQQFYAELYGEENFSTFLSNRAENAFNYETLAEPYETGTFTIKENKLMMIETGKVLEEALPYTIEGILLTLKYSDATHIYAKLG